MKSILTITLAIGAALAVGLVLADEDAERHPPIDVSGYDLDGDGAISRQEFDTAGGVFGMLDRDRDGLLSTRELSALSARQQRKRGARGPGGLFVRADFDGNDIVTAAEWGDFVATLDADGDGRIERPGREGASTCKGRGSKLDPDGDCVMHVVDFQNLFDELDADGNGELSREELPKPSRHRREPGEPGQERRQRVEPS